MVEYSPFESSLDVLHGYFGLFSNGRKQIGKEHKIGGKEKYRTGVSVGLLFRDLKQINVRRKGRFISDTGPYFT